MNQRKIAIIGDGAVGSSIAFALSLSEVVNEILIIDYNKDKAEGDALDMQDGNSFLSVPKAIKAGDYEDVRGSHVVVIAAGAAQKPGETRLDLLKKNVAIIKSVSASLKPYLDPGTIVLVVANPVDILSYIAYQELSIPSSRVIGSGTVLDTSRLKVAISRDTGIDPRSIHTFVVGEHGDSEVPLWSMTTVGGLHILDYCHQCGRCKKGSREHLEELRKEVADAAYRIIEKKGATYYAVAIAVSRIIRAIVNDENSILTVSTLYKEGEKGIYMSLPAIVNAKGLKKVLKPVLDEAEEKALKASYETLRGKIEEIA